MQYKRIHTGWIALALAIVCALAALCTMGAGETLSFPRVLWYLPTVLLDAIGFWIAAVLIDRARSYIRRRRESPNGD